MKEHDNKLTRRRGKKRIKRRKIGSKNFRIAFIGGSIIITLVLLILVFGNWQLNKLNRQSISNNDNELGINSENKELLRNKDNITNIFITGIDNDSNATDTNVILSINNTKKTLKMASLYRDIHIETNSGTEPKLNAIHQVGGITSTIKAINENFKTDIRDYVSIDIDGFFKVVDIIKGVTIDVPSEDVYAINKKIDYICKKDFKKINPKENHIKSGGKQELNTIQTMAYVRYRTSTGDFGRVDRTKVFFDAVLSKLTSLSKTEYLKIYDELAEYIETTLSASEMILYASRILSFYKNGIEQQGFPQEESLTFVQFTSNVFYYEWDRNKVSNELHEFLYN